ncbi:MAG: DUF3857 domain-containing protein [Deltaproteobacteria bacterium]|nr:DUF3857 domain-containing protein [Deltaproteobacteria bacterium]
MNWKMIIGGGIAALGGLWISACATTDKALIEQYASVTPTRYEGAVAVVLSEKETGKVGPEGKTLVTEGFRRIKIMNRKALDCGGNATNCRMQRWMCYNETWDKVEELKARLITPEGKVFEVKRDDMVDRTFTTWAVPDQDQRCYVWQVKGAQPGAIIEEQWKISTSSIMGVGGFWFQDRDPVLEASYTLDAPADYEYKWKVYNLDIKPTEVKKDNRIVRTWTAKQIPAMYPEDGMVAPDDVAAKLVIANPKIQAFIDGAKDEETKKRCNIRTWEDLGACWGGLIKETQKVTPAVMDVVKKIAETAKTETDKVKAVWKYMNENVRYVGLERGLAGFVPLSAHVVCSKKYGDCKAVASLISVMCRELGLKADPILIGTRPQLGDVDKDMPGPFYFNHSIARVEADGKVYWLDATQRDIAFDTTSARNQGVHVVVARPGAPFMDFIPVQGPETNRFDLKVVFEPKADGSMSMQADITTTGNLAAGYRARANEYTPEKWAKFIERELLEDYPKASLTAQSFKGKEDNNAPFQMEMKAELARALQPTGRGVSFELKSLFPTEYLQNYFKMPKRKYAVDLYRLESRQARFEVKIPEGMVPAGLPKNLMFEDDWVKVERLTQIEDDKVVSIYSWSYKQLKIPVDKYKQVRESFRKAMDAGQIVLIFEPPEKKESSS